MLLKSIALLLIVVYFLLPAVCFAHPCEIYGSSASGIFDPIDHQHSADAPDSLGGDNGETTCCCADHMPLSAFTPIPSPILTTRQRPYEPDLALPRLIDRIYIPPQNLA